MANEYDRLAKAVKSPGNARQTVIVLFTAALRHKGAKRRPSPKEECYDGKKGCFLLAEQSRFFVEQQRSSLVDSEAN